MHGRFDIEQAPGVVVLVLRGEHDPSTQPQLQAAIDRAIAGGMSVVVDLSAVEFIDSTVLSAILNGHTRATNGDDGREPARDGPPRAPTPPIGAVGEI
jgi:anti-anti-sigma factor